MSKGQPQLEPPEHQHARMPLDLHDWILAVAVFAIAFGLRVVYLGEIVQLPEFDMPPVDAGYHDYWAWGLASGDWPDYERRPNPRIESTPYFRPPLCPYFLSLIYGVFGHSYVAVRIVQMLVGSASCVLAYFLARRIFGRPTAVVSGFAMGGYWALVYFDGEMREVVLLVFLHLLLILSLLRLQRRPRILTAVGCGAVMGLAALGRPNNLLFVPVVILWLLAVNRGTIRPKKNALVNVFLLLGALVAVAPATVRNAVVAHDFVVVSSNGGINLYAGNNPLATGFEVRLPPPLPEFASAFDYPGIVRHVEEGQKRPMKHSQVSSYFVRCAIEYVKSAPGRCAKLALRKAVLFWGGVEIVSEHDLNAARDESFLLSHLPGNFAALFSCGAVGVVFALRRGPDQRNGTRRGCSDPPACPTRADVVLVLLFVAIYFASFLPFFVTARYRVPIIPFVIVFAAHGLVRGATSLRQRRLLAAGMSVMAIGALYLINGIDFFNVSADGFKAKYDRALTYERRGRLDEAIACYRQALSIRPHAPIAHNNLGIVLARQGKTDQAIEHYSEALRIEPDYAEAHNNLGVELLWGRGDIEGAIAHCGEAVRLKPDLAMARKNLGLALSFQGKTDQAIRQYRQALRIWPNDAAAHHNLGILLVRQERLDEAISEFREALRIDPNHAKAREALAAALAERRGSRAP